MSKTKEWKENKVFKHQELVQAYYHDDTFAAPPEPMHTHNFHELNIIISGNGKHLINNASYHIATGDLFIMLPQTPHGYIFDSKNYSIFHLLFHKHFFQKYEMFLNSFTNYHILFDIDPSIRNAESAINHFLHINISKHYNLTRIFNELALLEKEQYKNTEQKKEHLALYILALIGDMIDEENDNAKTEKQNTFNILKSVEYFHLNYGENISIDTLCSLAGMSRTSYLRYFKKLFHCPPIKYMYNYRLQQSKTLLKHSEKSIADIANECGFYDSAHFSRLFKEKYQLSPSKYQKLLQSKEQKVNDFTTYSDF